MSESKSSGLANVDFDQLVFGKAFTDHMIVAEFDGDTWSEMEIRPFGPMEYHPASHVFHYGQAIFEGLKAYKTDAGEVNLFRAKDNISRLNLSANRLAIPEIDENQIMDAIIAWLQLDRAWVPEQHQGSLYVRPFIIATSPTLRAIPSVKYRFMLIASPVGFYYDRPIDVKVESKYSRAVQGGVGHAKAAGNYAAAFMPSMLAKDQGYDQLIWTDRTENEYLEELGSANLFMVIDGVVYTPELHDSILAGITRDSVIKLIKRSGVEVVETKISKNFLRDKLEQNSVECLFATGTAAAITFIDKLEIDDKIYSLKSENHQGIVGIKKELEDYKFGRKEDAYSWNILL
ncbi:MAG: branched-chain amino acid aminotransferase [Bacteroidia bacterium]